MRDHLGKKVTAVILTHNRMEGAIKRCTEVTIQTRPPDEVILVDNASSDGTADAIARLFPQVIIHRLPENLGPAGGFAVGFTEAMRRSCDFIWGIDDDVVISPQCLEHLLAEAAMAPLAVVFPTRLPYDQKHGVAWRGMLVPAEIVRSVGVPRADFFWHLEDTEYFLHRIRDLADFALVICPRATVWHGTHRPRKGFPGWKLYYQTRNSIYYRFHLKRGLWRRVKGVALFLGRLAVICFREERGPAKAWMMVRGFKDGLLGILGKTVDPKDEPGSAYHQDGTAPGQEREEGEEALRQWQAHPEVQTRMLELWESGLRRKSDI